MKKKEMWEASKGNPRMGHRQPCILAIDLTALGLKTAVLSVQGDILAYEENKTSTFYREDGGVEQDPKEWWAAVTESIHNILKKNPSLKSQIDVISCTATPGTVAVDAQGEALGFAIMDGDARGTAFAAEVIGSGFRRARWAHKSCAIPSQSGKDGLAHILFLKEKKTYAYAKAFKFLEAKDYLNLKFTGKYAASFDSISGYWITNNRKIDKVRYDSVLLRMSGIDKEKVPELFKPIDILGPILPDLARTFGLPSQTQVVIGSTELQTAMLGSGAVENYAAHLNMGPSSLLTCHVPFRKTDRSNNLGTLPSSLPGRYFITNKQESAGSCLNYLWQTFAGVMHDLKDPAPSYERLDALAQNSVPGSRRIIFTPWINGESTPVEDKLVRGGFHNLSLQNDASDIVRSVYEGVAYNTKWLLTSTERFVKHTLNPIVIVGESSQSELWCQIHADILNRHIIQMEEPERASVRGAAWIACLAMGYLKTEDLSALVKIKKEYVPVQENKEVYTNAFKEFLELYRSNKNIYQRLNTSL